MSLATTRSDSQRNTYLLHFRCRQKKNSVTRRVSHGVKRAGGNVTEYLRRAAVVRNRVALLAAALRFLFRFVRFRLAVSGIERRRRWQHLAPRCRLVSPILLLALVAFPSLAFFRPSVALSLFPVFLRVSCRARRLVVSQVSSQFLSTTVWLCIGASRSFQNVWKAS